MIYRDVVEAQKVWRGTDASDSVDTFLQKEVKVVPPRFTCSRDDVFLHHHLPWLDKQRSALCSVKIHVDETEQTEDEEADLPTEADGCGESGQADHTVQADDEESVGRRLVDWLDQLMHSYFRRKIAETYRREREEGRDFYPSTFYFIRPMSRADRERQKRETWLGRDDLRRDVRKLLDSRWEERRRRKEARRAEEEERYERWAAERGAGVSTCPPGEPRRRMSKWEERLLRVKTFCFL